MHHGGRRLSYDQAKNAHPKTVGGRSDAGQAVSRHHKVVHWADHAFEEGILYVRVRFTDNTELCWRITSSTLLEEADLSDWKTGNFRQICVFVENKSGRE